MVALPRQIARVRDERGFGMIELLAAMTVMLIGVMSLFALFQAGIIQVRSASTITTAAALADAEMERFRAIKYEVIGLDDGQVTAADTTYRGDAAYRADASPATTLLAGVDAAATVLTVNSAAGFPAAAPFLIQLDSERMLVESGAGTAVWTVKRGVDGTFAAAHNAGATITQRQRAHLAACGTPPCTTLVPSKNVVGADGDTYRVDTYITWRQITNSSTPAATGRLLKLVTLVVREDTAPFKQWARLSSAFDESTGK
jgi:prepilin-type N-terminal cleavage/methylation domain-containing protein